MLQEHYHIRNTIKSHIVTNTHPTLKKQYRILHLIGSIATDSSTSHSILKNLRTSTIGSGRSISYWRGFVIHEGVGSIGALQWPAPKNIGQNQASLRGGERGGRGGGGGRSGGRGYRGSLRGSGGGGRKTPYHREDS
jgi:hypothetical protein